MRDPVELQEIEEFGVSPEEPPREKEPENSGFSVIPLVQTILCALVILALVFLKVTNGEAYSKATDWYRRESVREIELPRWGEQGKEAGVLPSQAESSETPDSSAPAGDHGALQRL